MEDRELIESPHLGDFARLMSVDRAPSGGANRLDLDPGAVKNGLGQLVLALVKLLHELLERQAVARMESGSLSAEEVENMGLALMAQADEIERLRREFNLDEEDLNLNLGPLGDLF